MKDMMEGFGMKACCLWHVPFNTSFSRCHLKLGVRWSCICCEFRFRFRVHVSTSRNTSSIMSQSCHNFFSFLSLCTVKVWSLMVTTSDYQTSYRSKTMHRVTHTQTYLNISSVGSEHSVLKDNNRHRIIQGFKAEILTQTMLINENCTKNNDHDGLLQRIKTVPSP